MTDSRIDEMSRKAAQLAAAGAVGASVAHELRNALAVAESSLFLARRDVDDRDKLLRHLDKLGSEIRRAQGVIGAVLGLARGDAVTREPAPIRAIVEGARRAFVLPTNVTFSLAIEPPELMLRCDVVLFERVLSNLYLNAVEALASRGRGAVATQVRRVGDMVEMVIEDDGPGIDSALVPTLFEPLVTSKPTGMGLGLALCHTIVKAHGGQIDACNKPSGGARFVLRIPD